jgi:hypothetical protein
MPDLGSTVQGLRQRLRDLGGHWGATPDEEAASYPCDAHLPDAEQWLYRAVTVDAPPAVVFRWLCQLRVAPYSYDWIDNRGRRSPRTLTPGLEDVAVGQRAMTIFEIVGVEPGRSITVFSRTAAFGDVAGTYAANPTDDGRTRLVAKFGTIAPKSLYGEVTRDVLPLGDLVMMRKQLLTLKELAERDAAEPAAGAAGS